MKKSAMIRARIDPDIKEQVEGIFQDLGISSSEAISLFYHQVRLKGGIPFDISLSSGPRAKSKIAEHTQKVQIEQSKRMTPEERLTAFVNHSFLMRQIQSKEPSARPARKRSRQHAR